MILGVQLLLCRPNEIDHYLCDVHPVLKLTCTDTYVVGVAVTANSEAITLESFLILLNSYAIILVSLRKQSVEGRLKALSTCGCHCAVVIIFVGSNTFMYLYADITFQRIIWWLILHNFHSHIKSLIYTQKFRNEEGNEETRGQKCFLEG